MILEDGSVRSAACIGGMLTVLDGSCSLLATTWEWQEDIDADRAGEAKERAQEKLAKGGPFRQRIQNRRSQAADERLMRL